MSSPLDDDPSGRALRGTANRLLAWNRRIHYYIGLYLLFFTWLFVFTGLLLNHPQWRFAQFWPNRIQQTTEHAIQAPSGGSDDERARDVLRQLGIAGEIQWPAQQRRGGPLTFQVSRPGQIVDIKVDLERAHAAAQRTQLNAWGVMHLLHTFTGVRAGDPRNARDWTLTTVWALTMDALAVGLIVMVLSSYIMWFQFKGKRAGGIVALLLGFIACGAFLGGLGALL